MAIAKNTVVGNAQTTTSLTLASVDCTGSNTYLVVVVMTLGSGTTPSAVAFNTSESLTVEKTEHITTSPGGTAFHVTVWTVKPSNTTADVVVTIPISANVIAAAQCYTGVDQTTPHGTIYAASDSGETSTSNPSVSVLSTDTTKLITGVLATGRTTGNTTRTPTSPANAEYDHGTSTYLGMAMMTQAGSASSTTYAATLGTATSWDIIGLALNEAGAGGGGGNRRLVGGSLIGGQLVRESIL